MARREKTRECLVSEWVAGLRRRGWSTWCWLTRCSDDMASSRPVHHAQSANMLDTQYSTPSPPAVLNNGQTLSVHRRPTTAGTGATFSQCHLIDSCSEKIVQSLVSWFQGKSIKIVASRRQILWLKCTKFDFGWGSAPDPAARAYSAPQTP